MTDLMDVHERTLLKAWADGKAGAGKRLARRAFAILCRDDRVDPSKLAQAFGSAKEAHKWYVAFDAMGLAGLVDAPRSGRPASTLVKADRKLSDASATHARRDELFPYLSPAEKHAIWRANRFSGQIVTRRHRYRDLVLRSPPDFAQLGAVFIAPGLHIFASIDLNADKFNKDHEIGYWLSERREGISYSLPPEMRRNVITTLPRLVATSNQNGSPKVTLEVLSRFVCHLSELAHDFPSAVKVQPMVDINKGELFIEYLSCCRRNDLWTPANPKFPSDLGAQRPITYVGDPARAIFGSVQALFPNAGASKQAKLANAVAQTAATLFAWVRVDPVLPDGALVSPAVQP